MEPHLSAFPPANVAWRKGSRSSDSEACVELAASGGTLFVRDSKAPEDGFLRLGTAEWQAVAERVRALSG